MTPRIVFKNIKKGDAFVSTVDQIRVGRRFVVERRTHKPKRVFMWTSEPSGVVLEFTMAQINRGLVREANNE